MRTTGSMPGAVAGYKPETATVRFRRPQVTYCDLNRVVTKFADGLSAGSIEPRNRRDDGRGELG